jgi:hypothetical protein
MHVYGSDTDPYDKRVELLNTLFDSLDPTAKTAKNKYNQQELPKLDAEEFINHA